MDTPSRLARCGQSPSAIGASAAAIAGEAILPRYRPIGRTICGRPDQRADWSSMTIMLEQAEVGELEMIRGTRPVLYLLASGTRRYSEVLYEVGEISKKTLTQTLRGLERDGLIARRVIPEVPARVEYSLTSLGWSITGPLMAMYEWAEQHLPDDVAHGDRLAA
jgi:DNA-binding HxlR family transcriptional regulator